MIWLHLLIINTDLGSIPWGKHMILASHWCVTNYHKGRGWQQHLRISLRCCSYKSGTVCLGSLRESQGWNQVLAGLFLLESLGEESASKLILIVGRTLFLAIGLGPHFSCWLSSWASQFLEATHIPHHVIPSIFKSAILHQILLMLQIWFSSFSARESSVLKGSCD